MNVRSIAAASASCSCERLRLKRHSLSDLPSANVTTLGSRTDEVDFGATVDDLLVGARADLAVVALELVLADFVGFLATDLRAKAGGDMTTMLPAQYRNY